MERPYFARTKVVAYTKRVYAESAFSMTSLALYLPSFLREVELYGSQIFVGG